MDCVFVCTGYKDGGCYTFCVLEVKVYTTEGRELSILPKGWRIPPQQLLTALSIFSVQPPDCSYSSHLPKYNFQTQTLSMTEKEERLSHSCQRKMGRRILRVVCSDRVTSAETGREPARRISRQWPTVWSGNMEATWQKWTDADRHRLHQCGL